MNFINFSEMSIKFEGSLPMLVEDNQDLFRLTCSICNKIMSKPTQAECGCRFCLDCVEQLLIEGERECSSCKDQDIKREGLRKDKAIERDILNLIIRCSNAQCTDIFPFKQLSYHLQICQYKSEQCEKCDKIYPLSTKEEHISRECVNRVVKCEDCKREMLRKDFLISHRNYVNEEDICEMWVSNCPYKCNENEYVMIKVHLKTCVNKPLKCPMRSIGCQVEGSRDTIDLHMEESRVLHQILMMKEIQFLKEEDNALRKSFQEREEKIQKEDNELKNIILENESTFQKLNEKCEKLMKDIELSSLDLEKNKENIFKDIVLQNGQATWTVKDIRNKIYSSKTGGCNQIMSESFYLAHPGYKMSMKVYLNGDGRATNKYLSAFFVINKGKYDSEISWPFKLKVTLSLLANSQSHTDIKSYMRPDNNKGCYGRPSDEYNVGAGQPEFARQSDILDEDHYLHEGALKLRISIS